MSRPCKFSSFQGKTRCTSCGLEWTMIEGDRENQRPVDALCAYPVGEKRLPPALRLGATIADTTAGASSRRSQERNAAGAFVVTIFVLTFLAILCAWGGAK